MFLLNCITQLSNYESMFFKIVFTLMLKVINVKFDEKVFNINIFNQTHQSIILASNNYRKNFRNDNFCLTIQINHFP
jgi:hypothetical protein